DRNDIGFSRFSASPDFLGSMSGWIRLLQDSIVTTVNYPQPNWCAWRDTVAKGRMFKRILIANRGEIACRIIKTARRMGIQTVAVYSDADKDALHVAMADSAVAIGPSPAAESYLVIDKIVAACKQSGAEAVHPGYGFLSEREAFPKALSAAGIA